MFDINNIPNDKYNVLKLEECWKEITFSDKFDEKFFCSLCHKTYELFIEFKNDDIPKQLIQLIAVMGTFVHMNKGEVFTVTDIASVVAKKLLASLENNFNYVIKIPETNQIIENNTDYIPIYYNEKFFQISTATFDFAPIVNKQYVTY